MSENTTETKNWIEIQKVKSYHKQNNGLKQKFDEEAPFLALVDVAGEIYQFDGLISEDEDTLTARYESVKPNVKIDADSLWDAAPPAYDVVGGGTVTEVKSSWRKTAMPSA